MLREAAAYMSHGLLFGFGYFPNHHRRKRARDIHTLVFVHGLLANRASFFPLQTYLSWKGFTRQYAYNYRSKGSIEALGIGLKNHLDREVKGGKITLIGHSMGGLVSRVYLQLLGGSRRVDTLITIATPHRGSHASAYMPTSLGAQLKPDGPFLEHLNGLPPPEGVRCVSFAVSEDLLVLPPHYAFPPFGEHHMVQGSGHLDILFSRDLFRSVLHVLTEQGPESLDEQHNQHHHQGHQAGNGKSQAKQGRTHH